MVFEIQRCVVKVKPMLVKAAFCDVENEISFYTETRPCKKVLCSLASLSKS